MVHSPAFLLDDHREMREAMRRLTLPTDPEYCAYCRTPLGSTRYLLTGSTVRYCSNECLNKAINKSSNGKKEKINEDEDRS